MTPRQRVRCVLSGRLPDRPPFSFWHHFSADQVYGAAAVEAHVFHLETFQLDFVKVMNDNGYPHAGAIASPQDLLSLGRLRGDEQTFGQQLDLIARLRRRIGRQIPMITTVFNAWATLRQLLRPPRGHGPPDLDGPADPVSGRIRDLHRCQPEALAAAIRNIAGNLARFARRCIDAGADGIYLSVRQDWVDVPGQSDGLYELLVRPADLEILSEASRGVFNVLHVCGRPVDLMFFNDYPVQAISWADRAAGPGIGSVADKLKPAICAGVDNLSTLPEGSPREVQQEVADAIRQAGPRPIIIAPGCTYDPERVPRENLQVLCATVQSWRYD